MNTLRFQKLIEVYEQQIKDLKVEIEALKSK